MALQLTARTCRQFLKTTGVPLDRYRKRSWRAWTERRFSMLPAAADLNITALHEDAAGVLLDGTYDPDWRGWTAKLSPAIPRRTASSITAYFRFWKMTRASCG